MSERTVHISIQMNNPNYEVFLSTLIKFLIRYHIISVPILTTTQFWSITLPLKLKGFLTSQSDQFLVRMLKLTNINENEIERLLKDLFNYLSKHIPTITIYRDKETIDILKETNKYQTYKFTSQTIQKQEEMFIIIRFD